MYELRIESVHGKIVCVVRDSRLRIVKMWPIRALLGQFDSLYDVAFFLRQDRDLPWYMDSQDADRLLGLKYPDHEVVLSRADEYRAFDPLDGTVDDPVVVAAEQGDRYRILLKERDGMCTPEQQAGPDATICPSCQQVTCHQHTGECMNCHWWPAKEAT